MKNKILKIIILIIKNLLPMSRRAVYRDRSIMLQLSHAQTEFMMLNRHDIVVITGILSKMTNNKKSNRSNMDNDPNMYG